MRTATLFYSFVTLPFFSFGQPINPVVIGSNNYKLSQGDELVIGLPAGSGSQFLFLSDDTTKAPVTAKVSEKTDGEPRVIKSTSIDDLMQDSVLQFPDKNVKASQVGSVWIQGKNPLTSTMLRIVRFDHYTDSEGRKHTFAIAETDSGRKYRIDLERAIYSGELSA